MADELRQFEAVLGAIGKLPLGEDESGNLDGAKCPSCGWSGFAKISDVYHESSVRVHAEPENADVKREIGMSDNEIVRKFAPPKRKSVVPTLAIAVVILGGVAYETYRRYGDNLGTIAILVAVVALATITLMTLRKNSDTYFYSRKRWNKLYRCRKCGQVIAA
jgi:hypothetical protein